MSGRRVGRGCAIEEWIFVSQHWIGGRDRSAFRQVVQLRRCRQWRAYASVFYSLVISVPVLQTSEIAQDVTKRLMAA